MIRPAHHTFKERGEEAISEPVATGSIESNLTCKRPLDVTKITHLYYSASRIQPLWCCYIDHMDYGESQHAAYRV